MAQTGGEGRDERKAVVAAPQPHESRFALLDDLLATCGDGMRLKPRVAGAERRMSSERHLVLRSEDPYPVVGVGVGRRKQEGRLRQVRPPCERLHLLVAQTLGIDDHGHRVPHRPPGGEHINLSKAPHPASSSSRRGRSRPSSRNVGRTSPISREVVRQLTNAGLNATCPPNTVVPI